MLHTTNDTTQCFEFKLFNSNTHLAANTACCLVFFSLSVRVSVGIYKQLHLLKMW